ncbi:MAG: phosphoribosylanthranilate isomerase [Nitrospirae bacterium]|nr:phosphoribosylanthranilate isomerase [Candidatus Troglogloeales bacterium]
MKVKICGITNLSDALAAIEYGADALGFIFAKRSARFIQKEEIKKIIAALPPFVTTVGVFTGGATPAKGTKDQLEEAISECGLDLIQLHGRFPREISEGFSERAIQVISVRNENALVKYHNFSARAYLLDSAKGGSGISFNWEIAREAKNLGKVILAGGLTPENVREAIDAVSPYAVDVCSGIEMEKGRKDHEKMRRFIFAAKGQMISS